MAVLRCVTRRRRIQRENKKIGLKTVKLALYAYAYIRIIDMSRPYYDLDNRKQINDADTKLAAIANRLGVLTAGRI